MQVDNEISQEDSNDRLGGAIETFICLPRRQGIPLCQTEQCES
jgi:hypothetical protein